MRKAALKKQIISTFESFNPEKIREQAKRLDRFYIPTRYPNGLPGGSPFQVYTDDDLSEAHEDLKEVFRISKTFLRKKGVK